MTKTVKQLKLALLGNPPAMADVEMYQGYLLRKQRHRWHYTMQYWRRGNA